MEETTAATASSIAAAVFIRTKTSTMMDPTVNEARQQSCSTMMTSISATENRVEAAAAVAAASSTTPTSSSAVTEDEALAAATTTHSAASPVAKNSSHSSRNRTILMHTATSTSTTIAETTAAAEVSSNFFTMVVVVVKELLGRGSDGATLATTPSASVPIKQQQQQQQQHCRTTTSSSPFNKRKMNTAPVSADEYDDEASAATAVPPPFPQECNSSRLKHATDAQHVDPPAPPSRTSATTAPLSASQSTTSRKRLRPREGQEDRHTSSSSSSVAAAVASGTLVTAAPRRRGCNSKTGGVLARLLGTAVLAFAACLLQSRSNSRLFVLGEGPRLRRSSRRPVAATGADTALKVKKIPSAANVLLRLQRRSLANVDPPWEQNVSPRPPSSLLLMPTPAPAPSSTTTLASPPSSMSPSAESPYTIKRDPQLTAPDDEGTVTSNNTKNNNSTSGTVIPTQTILSSQEPPTVAPSSTAAPSLSFAPPTMATSASAYYSAEPTMTVWVRFRVENALQVQLQIPSNRAVNVEAVATAWRFFLLQQLQNALDDSEIRVVDVFVFATLDRQQGSGGGGGGGRRKRMLQEQGEEEDYPFLPTFLDTKVIVDLARNPNAKQDDNVAENTNSTSHDDYNKIADTLIESFLQDDVLENALNDPNVQVANVKFTNSNGNSNALDADDDIEASNDQDRENPDGVDSGEDTDGDAGDDSNETTKPSPTQVVLGFLILGIAVGSLFFWAHVLWKKRQKRLAERRRQQVRKANTYVIGPSTSNTTASNGGGGGGSVSSAYGQAAAASSRQVRATNSAAGAVGGASVVSMASSRQTNESRRPFRKSQIVGVAPISTGGNQRSRGKDDNDAASESSGTSSYKGVGTSDDDTDVGSDAVSDPFARELQQAASLDEAAWNEFQRKKQDLQRQGRMASSMYATSRVSTSGGSSHMGGGFASVDDTGSHVDEEGVEVSAFPYGRESTTTIVRTSRTSYYNGNLVELSPGSSNRSSGVGISWTATTAEIAARVEESLNNGDGVGFEPYGDSGSNRNKENSSHRKKVMVQGMEEKWDVGKNSIKDEPGQYSFLNPSQRQNIYDETTVDSEDPTNVAIRVSPTTSASWSEAGGTSLAMARSSPTNDMTPLGLEVEENSKEDSFNALDMVKEVERLSAYVKRYEERKEKRQHGDFLGPSDAITSNHTSPTVGSSTVPYDAMSDSTSTRRAVDGHHQRLKRQDAPGHRLDHSPRDINEHDIGMTSRSRRADSRHAAQVLARLHNFGHDAVAADTTNTSAPGLLFGHGLEESSELTGSDSETDESMRLGIDRFSIEKPEPLLMSFRSSNHGIEGSDSGEGSSPERRLINLSEDDVPLLSANTAYQASPRSSPRGSLDDKVKRSNLTMSRIGKNRNRPHDERSHSQSMAPSDEREYLREEKKDSSASDLPLPPPPPLSSSPMASPRQTSRQSAAAAAAVRSKNQGFNSIISMFESKPKNPIAPPSDTWQNSGNLKTGITIGSPTRLGRRPMTPTKNMTTISKSSSWGNGAAEVDI